MYNETVMDHFTNPRNVGVLEDADSVAETGSAECGDVTKIYLKIRENRIVEVKFQTLGCAAAIASSYRTAPVRDDCVMLGEVGLSGELRSVGHADKRLREAAKLGFQRCILPQSLRLARASGSSMELQRARSVAEALDIALLP